MAADRFTTAANVPLVGDVDLEKILAGLPRTFTLKGMFFTRYVAEAFDDVAPLLLAPPNLGKYHAFEPYPMADYLRVFDRIARARFPNGSTREAYRLLARGEVEVYAESTLGKVTFAMLRKPDAALVRYPDLLGVVSKGPIVRAERLSANRVVIHVDKPTVSIENIIGVLEGLAMAFDVMPSMDVDLDDEDRASFTVRW